MDFKERLNDLDYFIKNYELFKEENTSKSNSIELVDTYFKSIPVEKIKDYKSLQVSNYWYVLKFDDNYSIAKNKKNDNIIFYQNRIYFFTITSNKNILIHDDNFSIFEKYEDLFDGDIWFYLKLKGIV